MRIAFVILLLLTVGCGAFGYWGVHTPAGRRAYDEMAGMIPMAAAWGSLLLAAATVVVGWFAFRGGKG